MRGLVGAERRPSARVAQTLGRVRLVMGCDVGRMRSYPRAERRGHVGLWVGAWGAVPGAWAAVPVLKCGREVRRHLLGEVLPLGLKVADGKGFR